MNRPAVSPAQTDDRDDVVDARPARHRARFELIFAGIWLAIGLILLPALIFAVGSSLLGCSSSMMVPMADDVPMVAPTAFVSWSVKLSSPSGDTSPKTSISTVALSAPPGMVIVCGARPW